jgi:hypothetical protein
MSLLMPKSLILQEHGFVVAWFYRGMPKLPIKEDFK